MIVEGATSCEFIQDIKGKKYVYLDAGKREDLSQPEDSGVKAPEAISAHEQRDEEHVRLHPLVPAISHKDRRVFITHGKNQTFIDPLKKLLGFGEFTAVVSVEKASISQPVPDKVMNDMRSCGAAIIHVDAEIKIIDKDDKEHVFLNPNVLIEIGAAMALFGRRFILLVREGVKLPSNLQGLFEVRYVDDNLDAKATIALMEAINELKKLPTAVS